MSGLDNLRSIFKDELLEKTELFRDNQPVDRFDTKLNYNETNSVTQTYGSDGNLNTRGGRIAPLLDSVLRGRVYEPIRFSQDFTNENLFVGPENPPFGVEKISQDSLGLFDSRSTTPKLDTLYFNTNNSFSPATNDGQITFQTAGGVDKGTTFPYSRLLDLGKEFISNVDDPLSWETLYQSNHTPKNNPIRQGLRPVSYPNVNRDNLKIGNRDRVIGGKYGFDRGDEPYVVSPIGNQGRDKNKGGRSVPITRALTDGDRILNFLLSDQGIAFALQQNVNIPIKNTVVRKKSLDLKGNPIEKLVRVPQRFGVTYNPLASLAVSAGRLLGQSVPNVLTRKSGFDIGGDILSGAGNLLGGGVGEALNNLGDLLTPKEYGPSATTSNFSINDTFTKGTNTNNNNLFSSAIQFARDFVPGLEQEVDRVSQGDEMTLARMITGNSLTVVGTDDKLEDRFLDGGTKFNDLNFNKNQTFGGLTEGNQLDFNVEDPKHGMPFYFKDMRDSRYIFFRAFIEGLTENISPSYASHNYVGRSEPVYTYERAEREISFTLKLVAQTSSELDNIYQKMDVLTSLCYPQYIDEGKDGYGNRMQAPLTKLRYGELFGGKKNELDGYIKSLSYNVDQSSPYETKSGKRVPMHVIATIGYQVIHGAPNKNTTFYGINQ